MVQYMWYHRTISTDLIFTILVLTPKVNTDTWGISFLEVLWKSVEAVINNRIKTAVKFHDVLHAFFSHQGTGTVVTKMNMSQDLSIIDQDPRFLVFL